MRNICLLMKIWRRMNCITYASNSCRKVLRLKNERGSRTKWRCARIRGTRSSLPLIAREIDSWRLKSNLIELWKTWRLGLRKMQKLNKIRRRAGNQKGRIRSDIVVLTTKDGNRSLISGTLIIRANVIHIGRAQINLKRTTRISRHLEEVLEHLKKCSHNKKRPLNKAKLNRWPKYFDWKSSIRFENKRRN